jgi:uncharacterized protein (DUF952 family)
MMIYKIWRADEWAALQQNGETSGAPIDITDGYIHFSTAKTVAATAQKYFADAADLIIASYNSDDFGTALKWEPARDGDLFPHLYAPLKASATQQHAPLPRKNGAHIFPAWVT